MPTVPPARAAAASSVCDARMEHFARREYAAAAAALDRCIDLDPTQPYPYYHAGMAYQEIDRVDLMITRFENFVRLAPDDAPERPRVEAILRTARR